MKLQFVALAVLLAVPALNACRTSNGTVANVKSDDGVTSGVYDVQVRLREKDEMPGSTIRFSDIRYATNGIRTLGLPAHSPLTGEIAEDEETNAGGDPDNNNVFFM